MSGFARPVLLAAIAGALLTGGCASSSRDADLGYDLVAVSPASGTITPSDIYPLRDGAWSWQVTRGDKAGLRFQRRRAATSEYGATWSETADGGHREFWTHDDEGNLVMTAVVEPGDQALTIFDPPMVIAYARLSPDGPRQQQVNMRVMDLKRPERMKDQGLATRTVEYVDNQLIRTPLGTMPVKRIEISFTADLGLARATNETTLLVYPAFGFVVETRVDRVTVIGIPLRHRDQTLVMTAAPQEPRD